MFLGNKYTRWYNALMSRAKSRGETVIPTKYVELHHILPLSLGGTNENFNLVPLTAREHFLAHLLLTKMTTGLAKRKMSYAFSFMLTVNSKLERRHKANSRWYEYSRILLSETQKGRIFTQETKNKMSKSASKRFESAAQRELISTWTKNPSKHTRNKIGAAARNRSEEAKAKMRNAKSKKCTVDGVTIFPSIKALANSLGWGKSGARSPEFRFIE